MSTPIAADENNRVAGSEHVFELHRRGAAWDLWGPWPDALHRPAGVLLTRGRTGNRYGWRPYRAPVLVLQCVPWPGAAISSRSQAIPAGATSA